MIQAVMDSTVEVGDTMTTNLGLGIFSTDAVLAGAASLPDPGAEFDYPWLWYGGMTLRSSLASGVPGSTWGPGSQSLEIDTKAMRKVKPGQSLVMVMEHTAVNGAPVVDFDMPVLRVLIGT